MREETHRIQLYQLYQLFGGIFIGIGIGYYCGSIIVKICDIVLDVVGGVGIGIGYYCGSIIVKICDIVPVVVGCG